MKFISRCIPWTGRLNEYGYGMYGPKLAHRIAWEKANGPIPAGMTIDHLCHDPEVCQRGVDCPHRRCVNVKHMAVVTADANRKRGYNKHSLKTHCPEGHPYAGENLMVSGGRRYCRTCRRKKLKDNARVRFEKNCESKGHTRNPKVGKAGNEYCTICATERGKATLASLGRDSLGRIASVTQEG